jgi:hypothetical protein
MDAFSGPFYFPANPRRNGSKGFSIEVVGPLSKKFEKLRRIPQ